MAELTGARQGQLDRHDALLLGLAVAAMALAIGGIYFLQASSNREATQLSLAHSLSTDVDGIVRIGEAATHGIAPDFTTLVANTDNIDTEVRQLAEGDSDAGINAAPAAAQAQVQATSTAWSQMKQTVQQIVTGEKAFENTAEQTDSISALVHGNGESSDAGGLYHSYETVAERMAQNRASLSQTYLISAQLVLLERISGLASRVLGQGRDAKNTAAQLDTAAKTFAHNNETLLGDSGPGALLGPLKEKAAALAQAVAAIQQNAEAVDLLQSAAASLRERSVNLIAAATALEQKLSDTRVKRVVLPIVVYIAGAIAILALLAFVVLNIAGVRERTRLAEQRDARQQQAILNLLDEITNLANGDLTVDVTVTEDFTGAIADSINYTVQTLRGLVGTINQTSEQIVAAAASTQDTAARMSEASDRQAQEITTVSDAATATSSQLQEVAGRAERLAVQAQTSVQIAHNGAGTVGRTIQSMASLREQIQDTAKRIKRLGESSQEIGNITELINDIAEQTNTLALNASIQAAMAGDQGRGFAVVADEVQRLAERAGSATRQIENLVKTIQADTNEAIISMERSTANVVSGAKSAEEAGQSLTRIEASSQELAKVMQEISLAARGQSAEATKIAGTMLGIREIAVQTSGSAARTSEAVGELNSLSDKLRESVAGFTLPLESS
ncbi:MAG: twitching motility protein PilJ [Nevskia sp.]|nr:twitching motility protein PilJ [Nevskia sp.]